jgi:hypothetical protein
MEIEKKLKKLRKEYSKLEYRDFYTEVKNPLTSEEKEKMEKLMEEINEIGEIINVVKTMHEPIMKTISNILKLSKGEKFQPAVTFQELIDYKTDAQKWRDNIDNIKFKRFVSFIDELQYHLKILYPFINLEGMDLSWTTNQLIDFIMDAHYTRPSVTVEDIKKMRIDARRESLADSILLNMRIIKEEE